MQKKLNVITIPLLAVLIMAGCSRNMKSRSVSQPVDPVGKAQIPAADPIPSNTPNSNEKKAENTTQPEVVIKKTPDKVKAEPNKPEKSEPQISPTQSSKLAPAPAINPIDRVTPFPNQVKPAVPAVSETIPPAKKPTPPSPAVKPAQFISNFLNFFPLLWEKTINAAKSWSHMIYTVIRDEESYLLGQNVADDIEIFCPTYRKLNEEQRMNFWGQFFAALAYHESGWSPVSRMVETTFTYKDSVTNNPVVSEGLLQLSYQDQGSYQLDCGFDWNKDKNLPEKDPRKTILDPYKNLRCGIKIMSIQLKKHRAITLSSNVYWAVLKTNGKYSKINEISKSTRSMKICQP